MPLPSSKTDLLSKLEIAYSQLDAELDNIPVELERMPALESDLSCCDVLAYQVGWSNLLLEWEDKEKAGIEVILPSENYRWNQIGLLNSYFYEVSKNKSMEELKIEFEDVYLKAADWIGSLSSEEIFDLKQRKWAGDKWALAKWIQVNTISPYKSGRSKVRKFKKENSILVTTADIRKKPQIQRKG